MCARAFVCVQMQEKRTGQGRSTTESGASPPAGPGAPRGGSETAASAASPTAPRVGGLVGSNGPEDDAGTKEGSVASDVTAGSRNAYDLVDEDISDVDSNQQRVTIHIHTGGGGPSPPLATAVPVN
jgi:hypothetical protein